MLGMYFDHELGVPQAFLVNCLIWIISSFPSTDVQANAFRKANQMGALQDGGLRADDGAC